MKETQQSSFCVPKAFVLKQLCVYHKRVFACNFESKFWFVELFLTSKRFNFLSNVIFKILSDYHRTQGQPFFWEMHLNFRVLHDTLVVSQFSV